MKPTRHIRTGKWTLQSRQEQVNTLIPLARVAGLRPEEAPREFKCQPKKAEAQETARSLELYWHGQGFPLARFWVETETVSVAGEEVYVFEIRSNLKNGIPPLACPE